MNELTPSQKRKLKSSAHSLSPVVQIGKNGLAPGLISAVNQALNDHELIKIKFIGFKDEKKSISAELAAAVSASIVDIVGNVLILFKVSEDENKRTFSIDI